MIELVVGAEQAGERLDVVLAAHPDVGSRAAAQRSIDAGLVRVDGRERPKGYRVEPGQRVEAQPPDPPCYRNVKKGSDPFFVPYEIVVEDGHLLVVDKPAGVVVHPAPGYAEPTLSEALAARGTRGGEPWRPGIVHRLDKDTSGLLVVAKSERVHRALQDQLRRRELRREYLALVEGRPDARTGTIDVPIGRDRRNRTIHSTRTDSPREAVTHFEIERALPRTTLLRVRLETGRTHQIRVHLATIGHPVCGDAEYGGSASGARLVLTRQFLHSWAIGFTHPITREPVACESKLPVDLLRALEAAAREPVSEGPDGD
ncbi:MAG: RluA family pseudouridine synthase [Actinomycetota bacterium]|nr:RluA family pseudouridine synthase [Actinomycetota bacterium]